MNYKYKLLQTTLITTALSVGLCGCVSSNSLNSRIEIANNIAKQASMVRKQVKTDKFTFTIFEKITQIDAPATIYIEGDGLAWLSRRTPSRNPTPKNPVALRLAMQDNISENVIYIARPCQYSPITKSQPCPMEYWTSKRFAKEVVESTNQAIDSLKNKYRLNSFNLVGYSGGGALAALIAIKRDDIDTLRTVAGNIDVSAFNSLHNVSQMPQSLNPADQAYKLSQIPQRHFIGENDKIVPPAIFKSFKSKAGVSDCINYTIVPNTTHSKGWENNWKYLMSMPVSCKLSKSISHDFIN